MGVDVALLERKAFHPFTPEVPSLTVVCALPSQVGTLEYMAPEVLLKQPTTAASDVYAWAVTVNEIATGVFPFADCTKENPQCQTVLNFGYGRCSVRPIHALHACSTVVATAWTSAAATGFSRRRA